MCWKYYSRLNGGSLKFSVSSGGCFVLEGYDEIDELARSLLNE